MCNNFNFIANLQFVDFKINFDEEIKVILNQNYSSITSQRSSGLMVILWKSLSRAGA